MRYFLSGLVYLIALVSACNPKKVQEPYKSVASPNNSVENGDSLNNDEVCMVNDMYMGKKQIPVIIDGKTYFGCCQTCKERLPQDATLRVAIDPVSKKQVDKATAFIAITAGQEGVSYFENRVNYEKFITDSGSKK